MLNWQSKIITFSGILAPIFPLRCRKERFPSFVRVLFGVKEKDREEGYRILPQFLNSALGQRGEEEEVEKTQEG